jgi:hypothetical protein
MKTLITLAIVMLTAATLLFSSCSQSAEEESLGSEGGIIWPQASSGGMSTANYDRGEANDYDTVVTKGETVTSYSTSAAPPVVNVDVAAPGTGISEIDRMIVRTGNLEIVVDDVPTAIEQITALAENLDGYVVTSRMWKSGERLDGSISIRVPSDDYEDTLRALRNLAEDVTYENSYSQDVTEEYVDLVSKLGNLEATEQQLLVIMEKAETVEDILSVQKQLTTTRQDIEITKGRMQSLSRPPPPRLSKSASRRLPSASNSTRARPASR